MCGGALQGGWERGRVAGNVWQVSVVSSEQVRGERAGSERE